MVSERELERIDRRHNIFMVLLIAMVAGVLVAFVLLGHTFTRKEQTHVEQGDDGQGAQHA